MAAQEHREVQEKLEIQEREDPMVAPDVQERLYVCVCSYAECSSITR